MDTFLNLFLNFSILDFLFIFFIIINSISGLNDGFVLSLLSFLKWILAIIITKLLLPILSPYTNELVDNEFSHDVIFGTIIFIFSIFLIILISKGLKKTINWSGIGSVDKLFGFIFGTFKGYIYFVLIFSLINFIYTYNKWDSKLNNGKFFEIIIFGNNFLIEVLPKRYDYIDKSKENVNKITK